MSRASADLIFKFIMTFGIAAVTFLFIDRNNWTLPFVVGTVATVVNYILGDIVLLPRFGNTVSAIIDGFMALLVALAVDFLVPAFAISVTSLFIFAITIAVGEYFFHRYLKASKQLQNK